MRFIEGSMQKILCCVASLSLAAALGLGQGVSVIGVAPGESIQAAINAAPEGSTVLVRSGRYEESLLVWKSLTLASDEEAVIHGGGEEAAVTIRADGVTLRGFQIQGARVGVLVDGVTGVLVETNTISANTMAGVYLRGCSGNRLYFNHVYKNAGGDSLPSSGYGIWLDSAHDNRIGENHIAANGRAGVCLEESHRNNLSRNTLWGNAPGWGDNVDVGCLVAAGGIVLIRSDENVLEDNALAGNTPYGIELLWSSSNHLTRNRVEPISGEANPMELLAGIAIQGRGDYCPKGPHATNNTVVGNVAAGCEIGILLLNTWGNLAEANTVVGNGIGVFLGCWFAVPPEDGSEPVVASRVVSNVITENRLGIGIMDGEGLVVPKLIQIERNVIARNWEAGLGWTGWRPEQAMVDARRNWWGDASGPYHPELNPQGKGDPISDGAEFSPWLDTPPHLTLAERLAM